MDKILLSELKRERRLFDFIRLKKKIKEEKDGYDWSFKVNCIFDEHLGGTVMKNVFRRFLDEQPNTSFEEFKNEIIAQEGADKYWATQPLLITGFISCTICWADTKKGHNFWKRMHFAWIKYLQDNIITPILGEYIGTQFYRSNTYGYSDVDE